MRPILTIVPTRLLILAEWLSCLCLLIAGVTTTYGQNTPTVALSTPTTSINENTGTLVTIEITISTPQELSQTFGLRLQGPGVVNEDFVNLPPNIEIPAGTLKGTVSFAINDDQFIEGVETVTASINNLPDGIDLASQSEASFNIVDNDFASIRLSSVTTQKTEGSPLFQFDVELDTLGTELKKDLVVNLALDTNNRAVGTFGDQTTPLIPGQDFRIFPERIVFSSGSPHGDKKSVEAIFHLDNRLEGQENASIEFASDSDTAAATLSARHTLIIQDQNAPNIVFSSTETFLAEGETNEEIAITLDLGTDLLERSIAFRLVPGDNDSALGNFPSEELVPSNLQGIDYNISPTSLGFHPEGPTLLNITVEALMDQLVEGEEVGNLSIQLTNSGFPQFTSPSPHTIKISDENLATVQFEADSSEVNESDQATNLNAILDTGTATLAVPLRITVINRNIGQAIGRFGDTTAEAETAPPLQ